MMMKLTKSLLNNLYWKSSIINVSIVRGYSFENLVSRLRVKILIRSRGRDDFGCLNDLFG